MNEKDQGHIFLLEKRIDELELFIRNEIARINAEIVRLDKADKKINDDACYVVDQARDENGHIYKIIRELSRVAHAAFFKTHPGVIQDIIKTEQITGKPEDNGRDPQP